MNDDEHDFIPSADVLFAENPEQRCPCVLLLDTSGSMSRAPDGGGTSAIAQLSDGLDVFKQAIAADSVAAKRVELAVVAFADDVDILQDFNPVEYFRPPELVAAGRTAMGRAIRCALELIERRKETYKANGVSYYRPWVFLITDGEPTDLGWEEAVTAIHQAEDQRKLLFFVVGVEPARMEVLARVAHPERGPIKLKDQRNSFSELFKWLSSSMSAVSRSAEKGGQITMPSPAGWGEIATN